MMREILFQLVRSFEKEIYWERTIHPTVRGGFSVRASPNDSSTSATLNALEPDIGDNSPRESLTVTRLQGDNLPESDIEDNYPRESITTKHLQRDDFEFPWAIYMQAKPDMRPQGTSKDSGMTNGLKRL